MLDNFEQVIDGAPVVADLLRAAPGLCVSSSRAGRRCTSPASRSTRFPGCRRRRTSRCRTSRGATCRPGRCADVEPATLSAYEAVRLFIARAVGGPPGLPGDERERAGRRGDRGPAPRDAARDRAGGGAGQAPLAGRDPQPARAPARRCSRPASRDLPERQQTLRGAIAWSYDLLDEAERRLLDRLSVLRRRLRARSGRSGVRTGVGARASTSSTGSSSLADQSLIRAEDVDGETALPDARHHPRVRRANGCSRRGEQRAELSGRHAACVPRRSPQRAAPQLSGDDQRRWLERLEREHDNIRAALDRAVAAADAGDRHRARLRACGASGRSAATSPKRAGGSTPWPTRRGPRTTRRLRPAHGSARWASPGGRATSPSMPRVPEGAATSGASRTTGPRSRTRSTTWRSPTTSTRTTRRSRPRST